MSAEIVTEDGRRLSLREINPADMLDLIEAAGTAAGSAAWMRYALMICSVEAIDGKPLMMPHTKDGVRELGRKIGNVGIAALSSYHYPNEADQAGEDVAERDQAKN
ncbi:hypothetical protein NFI95_04940 [Acetobacteraceae bacterium KSS8]|uniref:Uncharacterized protein n=1 Tax=Endosaccharibacter trunci TaxID=2812733 RepID=A0ABT1W4I4_9PROT|nr:hypothetical protein [Acetobacteraceae bacterium KSS8]